MTMNWSTQEHLHEKKGLLVMQNFVLKEVCDKQKSLSKNLELGSPWCHHSHSSLSCITKGTLCPKSTQS